MFGYMSGTILNSPRIVYALSRDNVIPIKVISKIHKSFNTPYIAIIVYATIGFMLAISGTFEQLAIIASSSMLILYLGVALSVIKLRRSQKEAHDGFKIPGGYIVPILSILIILYFLSNLSVNEMTVTAIIIGILSLIFLIITLLKRKIYD